MNGGLSQQAEAALSLFSCSKQAGQNFLLLRILFDRLIFSAFPHGEAINLLRQIA